MFIAATRGLRQGILKQPRSYRMGLFSNIMGGELDKELAEKSFYDFSAQVLDSTETIPFSKYKGKVCLVVNVASACGLTDSNYTDLVQLDEKYRDKGLEILAFPCNQFGSQESKCSLDIKNFAKNKYKAQFQMFEKIDVNGTNAHPLYKWLKSKQGGSFIDAIKWNFTKFLVDHEGNPVKRYAPTTTPQSIIPDIEKYLEAIHKPSESSKY